MKRFHLATLCEALSATYLTLVVGYYLVSGKYALYVVPRMLPFLYVFILILAAWSAVLWMRVQRYGYPMKYKQCLIFLLPAFFLTFPPPIATPYAVAASSESAAPYHITGRNVLAYQVQEQEERERTESVLPSGINQFKKRIVLTDKNFYRTLIQVGSHPENYVGYTVVMTGYVSHIDETLPGNAFLLARTVMACCIADVAPMGLPAELKNKKAQPEGRWMTVQGTLSSQKIAGREQPFLTIDKVEPATPIPGYIYP